MMGRLISFTLLSCAVVAGGVVFSGTGFMQDASDWQPAGMGVKRSSERVSEAGVRNRAMYLGGVVDRQKKNSQSLIGFSVAGSAAAQDRNGDAARAPGLNRPPKFARIVIKPERQSQFSGTGEPGQSVELLVDKTDVRQAKVGLDGRWTISGPPLGPGDHSVEVSIGLPGQSQRLIGQQVRIAIPKTSTTSEIVAYEQTEAERVAEVRARAERLARDASREFDRFGPTEDEPAKREKTDGQASESPAGGSGSSDGAGSDTTDNGAAGWIDRAQRDYFDYVVPELARKGGTGTGSVAPRGNVPPPVRPSDQSGDQGQGGPSLVGGLPSIDDMMNRARDWMKSANRTYQDIVVDDLRIGSSDVARDRSGDEPSVRVDAEEAARRSRELAVQRAQEQRRRQEEERRRQAELQERQRELARQRADAERQNAEEAARLAELRATEEEERRLDALLKRREAEKQAIAEEQAEKDRLARERELQDAERQQAEAEAAKAEAKRLEDERLRAEAAARAERDRQAAEAAVERDRLARLEYERLEKERLAAEAERAEADRQNTEAKLRNKEMRTARIGELSDEAGFGRKSQSEEPQPATPSDARASEPAEPTRKPKADLSEVLKRKAERAETIAQLTDSYRIPNWHAVEQDLLREDAPTQGEPETGQEEAQTEVGKSRARPDVEDVPLRPSEHAQLPRDSRAPKSAHDEVRSATETSAERRYSMKDAWAVDRAGTRTAGWAARFPPIGTGCADDRAGRTIVPPGTYVVARGDTLWYISWRHYNRGDLYRKIYRANRRRLKNSRLIYPCQKIWLPHLSQ